MRNTVADPLPPAVLHVAVAAIVNERHEVLISLRPDHVHQGGLWEFPGGKLEPGETVQQALSRELHEELGIAITRQRPLIRIPHQYADRAVLLDVWRVEAFGGEPHGREGQPLKWVAVEALLDERFPAANRPIIRALQLPRGYLVTPEPDNVEVFLQQLGQCLENGVKLVQLRARSLDSGDYAALAARAVDLCHSRGARILLNADPELALRFGADGVHLNGARLASLQQRPLDANLLVAASCHSRDELQKAQAIGADFAVLSPVSSTASHPGALALGWESFRRRVDECAIPVYALGGMQRSDTETAFRHGAQGIAAIRAFWPQ